MGDYLALWLSPQDSSWHDTQKARVSDGLLELVVPPFAVDMALKLNQEGD